MEYNYLNLINKYADFKPWYIKILNDFKFDIKKDYDARDFLTRIIQEKGGNYDLGKILKSFNQKIQSKSNILVFGCGPSLEPTVISILQNCGKDFFKNFLNFAADGSARLLEKLKLPIDAVFSDLDGISQNNFKKSYMIIHAHGDNISRLKGFKETIIDYENVIGTTQVEPNSLILNPGGFTDGDRILFFINSFLLDTQRIYLIGMDFNNLVGSFSKPELTEHVNAGPIKQKKLNYAVKILEWYMDKYQKKLTLINSPVSSKKFSYISAEDFLKLI